MQSQNKILVKNTIAQYIKIIFSVLGTLVYTRIVLQELGIDDYGIFSVIAGFIALFGVLNSSMIVAVQRFLSYEIPTGNYNKLNSIYSTSIFIHIGIALLVVLIAEIPGLYFVKTYMSFPEGKLDDAVFVFHCIICSFAINVISIPQQAALIAFEKIFISAIAGIIETALKVISAYILILVNDDKLRFYAIFFLAISIVIRIFYSIFVRIKISQLRFNFKSSKDEFKELTGFASWNLLGAIANIGKIQGVNILLNLFFTTAINAAYGIANQINANLLLFSSSIFQSSNSQIIQAYRKNDMERMNFLVIKTSKISFILFFTLSLCVFATTDELLYIWLGNVPEYCSIFIKLMIINSCIELLSTPLMYIIQASGRIKTYFITISSVMILILPIAFVLLKLGFNPYAVMYSTISINLILLYLRIWFVKKRSNLNLKRFTKQVILKAFITTVIGCITTLLIVPVFETIYLRLFIGIILSILIMFIISFVFILDSKEKETIQIYVHSKFK